MEWYRKADGEVVFGEIGARPPGARVVDLMNYATDGDLYVGWAEAVVHGRMQELERHWNVGSIFKRAIGSGGSRMSRGWSGCSAEFGDAVTMVDLLPSGHPGVTGVPR